MSKIKTAFFCSNCGYESMKWLGKCPACNQWNTFIEEVIDKGPNKNVDTWNNYHAEKKLVGSIALNDVNSIKEKRIIACDHELNSVLGGGIVPGSIILVAGEPG